MSDAYLEVNRKRSDCTPRAACTSGCSSTPPDAPAPCSRGERRCHRNRDRVCAGCVGIFGDGKSRDAVHLNLIVTNVTIGEGNPAKRPPRQHDRRCCKAIQDRHGSCEREELHAAHRAKSRYVARSIHRFNLPVVGIDRQRTRGCKAGCGRIRHNHREAERKARAISKVVLHRGRDCLPGKLGRIDRCR